MTACVHRFMLMQNLESYLNTRAGTKQWIGRSYNYKVLGHLRCRIFSATGEVGGGGNLHISEENVNTLKTTAVRKNEDWH